MRLSSGAAMWVMRVRLAGNVAEEEVNLLVRGRGIDLVVGGESVALYSCSIVLPNALCLRQVKRCNI